MLLFNTNESAEINRIESAAEPAGIVFPGDSIAVGAAASSPQKRFGAVLTGLLNENGRRLVEVNLAIGGSTLVQSGYPVVLPRAIAPEDRD